MGGVEDGLNVGLSNSIAQLVEKTFTGLVDSSKDTFNYARTRLGLGFKSYVESTYQRSIRVKTLISTSEPVNLAEAYEPAYLSLSKKKIHVDEFYENLGTNYNFSIISAMVGAGKSFTSRYI